MASKILLVDDALFQRMLCRDILADKGFNLIEAGSGEEALETLKHEEPDLVLLDITLPGKDGLEVLEEMREKFPRLKVIMLTAQGQKKFIMTALKLGASDYIVKPFNPDKLLAAVNKALGAKEGSD